MLLLIPFVLLFFPGPDDTAGIQPDFARFAKAINQPLSIVAARAHRELVYRVAPQSPKPDIGIKFKVRF